MSKTYFFDIDGTLSVPIYEFEVEGEMQEKCCMSDNEWNKFASNNTQAYSKCKVLPQVRKFLEDLKKSGATLIVLSVENLKLLKIAKDEFVRCNFDDTFSKIVYVDFASDKVPYIKQYAKNNNIPLEDCYLIEDTYQTLVEAVEVGINPIHITNIVYDYTKEDYMER